MEHMRTNHLSPISGLLTAVLALAACGGGGGGGGGTTAPPGSSGGVTVASVTLSGASSVALGGTLALTGVVKDGSGNVLTNSITWGSSDESIAITRSSGVVYPLKVGTVNINGAVGSVIGSKSISVTAAAASPATALNVAATNGSQFSPSSVTIAQNGSINFLFFSVTHNVIFAGIAGAPINVSDQANGDVQRVFGTKGTYSYTCSIHAGMSGTVIVQ